jgi:hypothetical protein
MNKQSQESNKINFQKKVRIYWNSTKSCWSIKQGSKVVGYADNVLLKNANFFVSENGRLKVLLTKRKNVHAFVEGFILKTNLECKPPRFKTKITYEPYKRKTFFYVDSKKGIKNKTIFFELFLGKKIVYESYSKG